MKFAIEAICNIGAVRKSNQDMILIGNQLIRDEAVEYTIDATERNFFVAVSDGMGGHLGGEVASELVVNHMQTLAAQLPNSLSKTQLYAILNQGIKMLHEGLNAKGEANPAYYQLGATFIGLLIYNGAAYSVNIGDSRLYRLRGGILAQLSNDHSLSNLLNDANIPLNRLANAFGGGAKTIFFDFEEVNLLDNDVMLLCSDGFNNELKFEQIENMLSLNSPLADMVNQAIANGGNDNISAIKICISSVQ
ncbi:protein phosphatase [Mucilaginibacter gracilis]|uniref:Protein phosphatase n=1 Tax=Mucilaginibacter gracilis TaxID=423350 RepID=A0A495J002_9SPHI|nr:protein phosphatase 2C domain-containing protein [Mucilaginibacter gracilis]RKR82305.1 protein phosphatase [Mucilaginibacter gracilis]